MTEYTGKYLCKVDAKGRVMLPASLLKQFEEGKRDHFILNRSLFTSCIDLYTTDSWKQRTDDIRKLDPYDPENDRFIRQFYGSAVHLDLDSVNRMLIPRSLVELVGITTEVLFSANLENFEMWSPAVYDQVHGTSDPNAFHSLAAKVMKGIRNSGS
jgi:MraZ protein